MNSLWPELTWHTFIKIRLYTQLFIDSLNWFEVALRCPRRQTPARNRNSPSKRIYLFGFRVMEMNNSSWQISSERILQTNDCRARLINGCKVYLFSGIGMAMGCAGEPSHSPYINYNSEKNHWLNTGKQGMNSGLHWNPSGFTSVRLTRLATLL